MGIGDWGFGDWPNPQSPIPNAQSPIPIKLMKYFKKSITNLYFLNISYIILFKENERKRTGIY